MLKLLKCQKKKKKKESKDSELINYWDNTKYIYIYIYDYLKEKYKRMMNYPQTNKS